MTVKVGRACLMVGGASYLHSDVSWVCAVTATGDVELQCPGSLTGSVAGGRELDPGPEDLQSEERDQGEIL